MNSPSPVTITVGDLVFRTIAFGYDLGPTLLKAVTIAPGANTYDAEFQLTPTADPAQQGLVGKILSGYLMGGTFPLTVQGNAQSSTIASLQEGLAGVSLATSITGVPPTLITSTKVVALSLGAPVTATTYVTLTNPLDVSFSLVSIQAQIINPNSGSPYQLAHINYNFPTPFTVGAKQAATTPGIPLIFDASLLQLLGLVSSPVINVNIVQNATVIVGNGFGGILSYAQNNVPSYLDPFSPATLAAINSTLTTNSSYSALSSGASTVTLPTITNSATPTTESITTTMSVPQTSTTTEVPSTTTTSAPVITTAVPSVTAP